MALAPIAPLHLRKEAKISAVLFCGHLQEPVSYHPQRPVRKEESKDLLLAHLCMETASVMASNRSWARRGKTALRSHQDA